MLLTYRWRLHHYFSGVSSEYQVAGDWRESIGCPRPFIGPSWRAPCGGVNKLVLAVRVEAEMKRSGRER